jgi:hypothetical protein
MLARHKPFLTIQRGEQVFRRLASLDSVPRPNFNCLCLSHSPVVKRKHGLAVQYALQDRRDGFCPGVNRIYRDQPFPIPLFR